MNIERALETQRLKLLRLVTGLFSAVFILSAVVVPVGSVSGAVSRWALAGVSSILSRAELAGQYLLIGHALLIARNTGSFVDRDLLFAHCLRERVVHPEAHCASQLYRRLVALRALIMDLPRRALRLLRKLAWCGSWAGRLTRRTGRGAAGACHPWRLARFRIERPPDKGFLALRP